MIKKSIAFTLAESLLVMAVIGVVATLVVPNLKNNSDDQIYISRAKKMFTEFDTAFSRATLKYGQANKWTVDQIYTRLGEYLNTKKYCTKDDDTCIQYTQGCTNHYMILKDGSSFCVSASTGLEYIQRYYGGVRPIFLDLDGPAKGNNKMGKDMFAIGITRPDGFSEPALLIDYAPVNTSIENSIASGKTPNPLTYFHWIMEYGNMDFNKGCSVKWETKTSCN